MLSEDLLKLQQIIIESDVSSQQKSKTISNIVYWTNLSINEY